MDLDMLKKICRIKLMVYFQATHTIVMGVYS